MELEVQRVWLRLLINIQPDGRLVMGVTDDLGRTVRPLHTVGPAYGWSEDQILPSEGVDIGPLKVRWPSALPEMLAHAIERLPVVNRHGSNYPPAVPVLVAASPELALVSGDIVERLLRTIPMPAGAPAGLPSASPLAIGEDRWVVLQDRVMPRPVLPFSLPLDLVAVGARGAEALARVAGPWVTPDQQLQPHLADVSWLEEPRDVLPRLAQRDVDILLIDASDAWSLASMMRRGPSHPFTVRAVVVLGLGDGGPLDAVDVQVSAHSVLTVKGPPTDAQLGAVKSFLSALSHDLPLHDALVMARRENPEVLMDLSASPESLHDLRLTSAWAALERGLAELSGLVGPGTPEELSQRISGRLGATVRDAGSDLITGVTDARTMQVDFAKESRGLHPLARARRGLTAAAAASRRLRALPPVGPKPAAQQPPRVVNIGLRRGGDILAAPDAGSTYLDAIRSLVAGGRYELDVQIGAPWVHSLVVDDPKTAQLHLPDDRRGNELQVTLFSDDVAVLGEHTQTLYVPPAGPSDVLTFELALPNAVGPTWLRLSVFHRDNLLKTFRLAMLVTTTEAVHPEPVLAARLEHSATRDWTNVPQLGDRALSLTLNADPVGGHRIFLKRGKVAATLPVEAARENQAVQDVRQILTDSVNRTAGGAETVWRLAQKGEELYHWIRNRLDDTAAEAVRQLRSSAEETVQIVRAAHDQAVPWSLVYDWSLPQTMYGDEPPPVCFGRTDAGGSCTHGAGDKAVCVFGFWGMRHRLEELLADPTLRDMPQQVAVGNPGILVALGVQDDATKTLQKRLSSIVEPGAVRTLTENDRLLDSLFHKDRPGIVLVLGHNKTNPVFGEPKGSRIQLLTADRWLQGIEISRLEDEHGRWQPPHSIVLLLSCGSAAPAPTELTSFLSALQAVKAGAIVGTECDIYSDLAVEFTLHLLAAMTGRAAPAADTDDGQASNTPAPPPNPAQTFAQAVRLARHRIVVDKGDPRGFAFGAFGPAELTLVQASLGPLGAAASHRRARRQASPGAPRPAARDGGAPGARRRGG